ncbi:MAG: Ig-like domain-containing protein, partial [Methanobrevibacter sp.]|nr:Ig-like domain-containing protein [Methanobrevibacter sp.]
MKSKQYSLVVLSVLILLLFITSASAAEINETDGVSIDEPVNLENNLLSVDNNVKSNEIMNDTLKESNSELLTAGIEWYVNSSKTSSGDGKSEADAFKTLNEALTNNELQDYDTIMIASGEYKGIDDNIGLTIVKNLNFIKYGDGEAIFDAEGLSRILTVNSTSVNITGLTFKNGNSTHGGAIFISHEIDESNIKATFINNTAEEHGGAIYIVSGGISGNLNSIFINNTASYEGGAIYIDSGGISGNVNGTFINNKAGSGSAIFIAGDISGNVNGTFINNEAKGLGAIYIYNGDASGNVKGTFINNIANRGGAIAVGDDGTVSGNIKGTFINNTGYYAGGAICIANSERYPTGNLEGIFINNKAESGGAIYIEFTYENPVVSLGGTFINNNASSGGAIHINQMFAPVTIQDSIFLNNSDALSFGLGDYIKTVDCWFGNNATNYNVRPDAGKAVMDRWLFLNATANPADVSIDENSIIAFKLDSYDNSSGKVKPYDASKMNIILDLTQTLGDLDKTAASIDENITYTARQGGNSCITGKYETVSYTIELNNVKLPTEINVINSTIALKANEEVDAGATLSPTEAGNLTYTSNNTDVVIVENGKIKSIKKGNATITVSFAGDERYAPADNKTISVSVSLIDTSVAAENMTLNVGESGIINYTVTPEELKVNFVADNSGVVSVDEDGTVKALKNGTANITINVGDDEVYAKNSAVITVTVNLNDASVVAEDMELNVSESGVINYTVNPEGLNVTFTVDNSGIVSVDENGTVKALKEGKTNVTLIVGDGKVYVENSTIITITVSRIPTMIAVNDTTFYLDVGDEVDPGVSLIPSDAGELDYVSSDVSVVVVNGDGTFTAVGNGTANITVSFSGNEKFEPAESKIIDVTVSKIPTEIFVRNATVDMKIGDEVDSGVRISPSDAGELDYVSSDVSVVRVDGDGTFVAVAEGSANVTVSFSGNAKFEPAESKIITVTVSKIPTEIFVRNATVDMKIGDEVDPGVRISPSGAGELDYVSSDVSVVRVDGDGTFVAVAEGSANVTVSFSGNEKFEPAESKIITVTVSKIPTEIFVRNATIDFCIGDKVDPGVRISPSDAGELDYVSSDVSVVRVDGDGTFVAVGEGTANVTVSFSGNDKFEPAESKIIAVTVSKSPTEIFVRNATIDLSVDDNATISYKLIPKDAEGDVRFMSNDTSIVYADAETGVIVGRAV